MMMKGAAMKGAMMKGRTGSSMKKGRMSSILLGKKGKKGKKGGFFNFKTDMSDTESSFTGSSAGEPEDGRTFRNIFMAPWRREAYAGRRMGGPRSVRHTLVNRRSMFSPVSASMGKGRVSGGMKGRLSGISMKGSRMSGMSMKGPRMNGMKAKGRMSAMLKGRMSSKGKIGKGGKMSSGKGKGRKSKRKF